MVHGEIVQGTTADLEFDIPTSFSSVKDIHVSFSQKERLIFVKTLDECQQDLQRNTLIVPLSQQDTYLLDEKKGKVSVLLRILDYNGKVIASNRFFLRVQNLADKIAI